MKKKYFVEIKLSGLYDAGEIEAKTYEEALEKAYEKALENLQGIEFDYEENSIDWEIEDWDE